MTAPKLPTLVVRFPVLYAWMVVGFGAIFLILGLAIMATAPRSGSAIGELVVVLSVLAIIGGNYWRNHRHEVARLTPGQLVLRREGIVKWEEIAAIEKREFTIRWRGRHTNEFACIRLWTPRPPRDKLTGWMQDLKKNLTGYDITIPGNELDISIDRFVEECKKRLPAGPPTP